MTGGECHGGRTSSSSLTGVVQIMKCGDGGDRDNFFFKDFMKEG